jgi:signal transduction histidine kinase
MISVDDPETTQQNTDVELDSEDRTVNISCNSGDNYVPNNSRGYRTRGNVIAMVNVNGNQKQEVLIHKSVMVNSNETPEAPAPAEPPVSQAWPSKQAKTNLIRIVNNVADEYAMSKMKMSDVYDVIDSQKISSAIRKEFSNMGLPQDFVFATYCVQGDTLMINRASSTDPLHYYSYKSPLLATDFIEASSMLLIKFPSHFRYIFSSVAGMLVLSFLFTITILAAFIYSLQVIYRQKKLSDITNDFINNMTHELKTPLATISMTADTLGLSNVSNSSEMVNEYSGMIKNEAKKLSRHVDRILEAAVLERNGNASQKELINLNQMVADEVKIFEPVVQQKDGQVGKELPAQTLTAYGNKDLLRGAICNLLDNAVKYSKDVVQIKVSLVKVGDKAVLAVEDKGIGISKVDQKMVFEKFFRAGTGNRHDVKGFGLGLSFVKTVIENIGGKVAVESELGKGSKFFIEIPITQ